MKYYSLNNYLKDTFGCKVYKLSLDANLSCPNRDGTLGDRGCIFCNSLGSGDFAEKFNNNITEQIDKAKLKVKAKTDSQTKYIAYFQSYTNTYGPIEYLEKIFTEAILQKDIVALSIATRPDCLNAEILSLIKELNNQIPVWIELGFQTSNETSSKYIRRGFSNNVYFDAVKRIKNAKKAISNLSDLVKQEIARNANLLLIS